MTFVLLLVQVEGAAGPDRWGAEQGSRACLAVRHGLEVDRTSGAASGAALETAQLVAMLCPTPATHRSPPGARSLEEENYKMRSKL